MSEQADDPPEVVKVDYEKIREDEYVRWKFKLKNIFQSDTFCGMCLEDGKSIWDINACITIAELGPGHECSLQQILVFLFGPNVTLSLSSNIVCEECTDKAIQAYLFIQNTKKTSRILMTCVNYIEENVDYTLTSIENVQEYEKSIICLNLQNIIDMDETEVETDNIVLVSKQYYDCKLCNRTFASLQGLTQHEEKHRIVKKENSDIKIEVKHDKLSITQCSICKLVILNVELEKHVKSHDQRTWHCSLCDKVYYSSSSFDTHLMMKHNKTKDTLSTCDLCMKTFFSKEMLNTHKCKYRCTECAEMPCSHHKYLIAYKDQKQAGHLMVQCPDCDFKCSRKISMLSHVNIDHLQRFNNLCNSCGLSFQSKPALTQHKRKFHNEVFNCVYCNEDFGSESLLDKHQVACQKIEKPFRCDFCSSTFLYEAAMVEHMKHHYCTELSCPLCPQKFWNANELEQHKKENHKVTMTCTMCIEDFHCRDKYKEHVATHPPGTKHICRVCNASFNSKINHRKHNRWHTMSLEKRICPVCSKYINASYYPAHVATHSRIKTAKGSKTSHLVRNFKCDLCEKHFVSSTVLKRHKEIHKDHSQCHICKKYVKPAILENHIKDHKYEKMGIKKKQYMKRVFACDKCDYVTHYPLCIEAHENRVHLKTRPFQCETCDSKFYGRNNLAEHIKSHHRNVHRKQCSLCSKYFATSQCLKKHIRLHTGEKPYPCDECDEKFMSASRRQEHKIRRHSAPKVPCPICKNVYHTVRDVRAHIKKSHGLYKGEFATIDLQSIPEEHHYIFKDHRRLD